MRPFKRRPLTSVYFFLRQAHLALHAQRLISFPSKTQNLGAGQKFFSLSTALCIRLLLLWVPLLKLVSSFLESLLPVFCGFRPSSSVFSCNVESLWDFRGFGICCNTQCSLCQDFCTSQDDFWCCRMNSAPVRGLSDGWVVDENQDLLPNTLF